MMTGKQLDINYGIDIGFKRGIEQGIERGIERGVKKENQQIVLNLIEREYRTSKSSKNMQSTCLRSFGITKQQDARSRRSLDNFSNATRQYDIFINLSVKLIKKEPLKITLHTTGILL